MGIVFLVKYPPSSLCNSSLVEFSQNKILVGILSDFFLLLVTSLFISPSSWFWLWSHKITHTSWQFINNLYLYVLWQQKEKEIYYYHYCYLFISSWLKTANFYNKNFHSCSYWIWIYCKCKLKKTKPKNKKWWNKKLKN